MHFSLLKDKWVFFVGFSTGVNNSPIVKRVIYSVICTVCSVEKIKNAGNVVRRVCITSGKKCSGNSFCSSGFMILFGCDVRFDSGELVPMMNR